MLKINAVKASNSIYLNQILNTELSLRLEQTLAAMETYRGTRFAVSASATKPV